MENKVIEAIILLSLPLIPFITIMVMFGKGPNDKKAETS